MGDPWHLVRGRRELQGVEWLSSNYALHGDMSRGMYLVLYRLAPRVEPYSIDEMFLDLMSRDPVASRRCQCRFDPPHLRRSKIPQVVER